jgi:ABC-type multidrug transport system permease subunit
MIFDSLYELVRKDLKMFFRSKVSSVFVILIPFLIILLAGFAFNSSNLSNVQVGVYSNSYDEVMENIILNFDAGGFNSIKYSSDLECIDSVKSGDSQICVIFPEDLSSESSIGEIVFYVDYSRSNLADTLVNDVESSVSNESSSIGLVIINDLIDALEVVKRDLPETKEKVNDALNNAKSNVESTSNFINPTENVGGIIVQLGVLKESIEANNTNAQNKVDEIVVLLGEVNTQGEQLSSDLNSNVEKQGEIVNSLNLVLEKINVLLISLNSNEIQSAEKIISPVKTRIEPINPESKSRDYLIPTLLSLIAMFGSILLASTFVLKSKKTRAFFRNFMTPTKSILFIISTYLTCLIVLLVQFIFVFIGIKFILKMNIFSMPLELLVVLFLSLTVFIFIGMFIGYLFRSEETIIFASMIIATLFMFFSNAILPLENISSGLMKFAMFNPLVVSSLAFKKVVLFGLNFSAIGTELFVLAGFFVVFFGLTWLFRRMNRRSL